MRFGFLPGPDDKAYTDLHLSLGRGGFLALLAALALPTHADAATTYVRAGRLVDVVNGRVLTDQLVTIEDGRIAAVGAYASAPEGETIDWSSKTVLPGLIDMHSHLVGDIQSAGVADPLLSSAAEDALIGAANARATLRAGFTSVRDVGAYRAFTDVALRDAINKGYVEGPRMAVAGGYLTIPGGGGALTGLADDVTIPAAFERGIVRAPTTRERKRASFCSTMSTSSKRSRPARSSPSALSPACPSFPKRNSAPSSRRRENSERK